MKITSENLLFEIDAMQISIGGDVQGLSPISLALASPTMYEVLRSICYESSMKPLSDDVIKMIEIAMEVAEGKRQ